jgi:hypothetical protein
MIAAGTLQASCNGRPCRVVAEGSRLVLHLRSWRDLWSLRRNADALRHIAPTLERAGMGLSVRIRSGRHWPILPRPHMLARWILPTLRTTSPQR